MHILNQAINILNVVFSLERCLLVFLDSERYEMSKTISNIGGFQWIWMTINEALDKRSLYQIIRDIPIECCFEFRNIYKSTFADY